MSCGETHTHCIQRSASEIGLARAKKNLKWSQAGRVEEWHKDASQDICVILFCARILSPDSSLLEVRISDFMSLRKNKTTHFHKHYFSFRDSKQNTKKNLSLLWKHSSLKTTFWKAGALSSDSQSPRYVSINTWLLCEIRQKSRDKKKKLWKVFVIYRQ